jgi:hypothetical protein
MDINSLAKHIVDQAIGEKPTKKRSATAPARGFARKKALTPERRSEIAKSAAKARWERKIETGE